MDKWRSAGLSETANLGDRPAPNLATSLSSQGGGERRGGHGHSWPLGAWYQGLFVPASQPSKAFPLGGAPSSSDALPVTLAPDLVEVAGILGLAFPLSTLQRA